MSKLSEYAAKKSGVKFSDLNKTQIIEKLYDKISNLDFKVYKYKNIFILAVDDVLVKISDAKTSGYGLCYAPKIEIAQILSKVKDEDLWYYVNNINKENDYIDIKDLLIYCENEAIPLTFNEPKAKLESEIDNGFRKQDVIFGKDTLEEDVKFNEWLHKRIR